MAMAAASCSTWLVSESVLGGRRLPQRVSRQVGVARPRPAGKVYRCLHREGSWTQMRW